MYLDVDYIKTVVCITVLALINILEKVWTAECVIERYRPVKLS